MRLFLLPWGYSFCCEVFSLSVSRFLFSVRFFFCGESFSFCRGVFSLAVSLFFFAARFFLLPWGYFFGREVISLAWQLWATVLIDLERSKNTIGTTIISGETEETVSGFSSYRLRSSCEVVWRIQRRWLEKRVHRSRLKKSRVSPF